MTAAAEIRRIQEELRHEPLSRGGENLSYAFDEGRKFGLQQALDLARTWNAENKASAADARREGRAQLADMLDGSAIETNALAHEIANLIPQSPVAASQDAIDAYNAKATGTPL